ASLPPSSGGQAGASEATPSPFDPESPPPASARVSVEASTSPPESASPDEQPRSRAARKGAIEGPRIGARRVQEADAARTRSYFHESGASHRGWAVDGHPGQHPSGMSVTFERPSDLFRER